MLKLLPYLALALVIRLLYFFFGTPLEKLIWSDMNGYVTMAQEIGRGLWKPIHFFQAVGYPSVILLHQKLFLDWPRALHLFQILISTATLVPMYFLAKDFFGERIARRSVLLGALHVPWVLYTGHALAETVFAFCLSLLGFFSVEVFRREKKLAPSIGWGLSFAAGLWLKGTHIFLLPLFLGSLMYFQRRKSLESALAIGSIFLVNLLLHGWLTHATIGKIQFTASSGGLNFVEGKCAFKNNADSTGYAWLSPLYHQLDLHAQKKWNHPFTDSTYFMKEGLKCILENPGTLLQSLEGLPFLFFGNILWPLNHSKMAPQVRLYEVFFSVFLVVGFVVFLRSLWKYRKAEEIVVWVTPILSLFICVYVFKSEVRFRLPFDVWLIPMSLRGWEYLKIS